MLYGIAVFPNKQVQDAANSWRLRHDPHYCDIPAHMTVREAEQWTEEQLQKAIAHLEQITAVQKPFTIHFNRVSTFYPVSHVLYLALQSPAPMEQLQQSVCSGPLAVASEKYVYTPHVTIGQNMAADELHDLYGNLRMNGFDLTTSIDRLHLLYQTDSGSWTVHQTFLLRG